jgi:hypothetical protein
LKYLILTLALILFFPIASCRDYITDVIDKTPPTIAINESTFSGGDTVTITLINNSNSPIFVTGAYSLLEKKVSADWITYSIVSCGGCPEFQVYGKSSITTKDVLANDEGVYRFVCAYSIESGETFEQKSKVYSGEFTVFQR